MVNVKSIFVVLVCSMFSALGHADNAEDSALMQTQDCLQTQNCDAMKTTQGQSADRKALEAVGGSVERKKDVYQLSAVLMPYIMQQAGSDPSKMQELLLKAEADPESFLNSLPPDIQAKIRATAKAVEAEQAVRGQGFK